MQMAEGPVLGVVKKALQNNQGTGNKSMNKLSGWLELGCFHLDLP